MLVTVGMMLLFHRASEARLGPRARMTVER